MCSKEMVRESVDRLESREPLSVPLSTRQVNLRPEASCLQWALLLVSVVYLGSAS